MSKRLVRSLFIMMKQQETIFLAPSPLKISTPKYFIAGHFTTKCMRCPSCSVLLPPCSSIHNTVQMCTSQDSKRAWAAARDCSRLLATARDCSRLLATARDCSRLSQSPHFYRSPHYPRNEEIAGRRDLSPIHFGRNCHRVTIQIFHLPIKSLRWAGEARLMRKLLPPNLGAVHEIGPVEQINVITAQLCVERPKMNLHHKTGRRRYKIRTISIIAVVSRPVWTLQLAIACIYIVGTARWFFRYS
jgi:hypothetical protein